MMFHSFFCINTHPCDDSSSRSTNNKNSFLPLAFMSLNVSRCFPPLEAVVSTRCEFNVLLAVLCVCSRLSTLTPVLLFHSSSALQVRSDPGFYAFLLLCHCIAATVHLEKRRWCPHFCHFLSSIFAHVSTSGTCVVPHTTTVYIENDTVVVKWKLKNVKIFCSGGCQLFAT